MKIVLHVFGSRGDINPMLAVGRVLAARGCAITLCSSPDFAADALAHGFAFAGFGSPAREIVSAGIFRANPVAEIAAQFRVLDEVARDADLIVGAGVPFAAPSVAEKRGVPYRYVAFVPTVFASPSHPPALAPQPSMPRPLNRVAWALYGAGMRGYLGAPVAIARHRLGLPVSTEFDWVGVGAPPDILAADRVLAPLPPDLAESVVQVPAAQYAHDGELSPALEEFLAAGEPPVYFGFGSVPSRSPRRHAAIIADALGRTGRRFVFYGGWSGIQPHDLPAGRCISVDAEPHERLFPRCAAVIHHGGAGTTTTAARAGTPQVVVPYALDQSYWAMRVGELGIGALATGSRRLSARALVRALDFALRPSTAVRAREVADSIGPADGAAAVAEELLRA